MAPRSPLSFKGTASTIPPGSLSLVSGHGHGHGHGEIWPPGRQLCSRCMESAPRSVALPAGRAPDRPVQEAGDWLVAPHSLGNCLNTQSQNQHQTNQKNERRATSGLEPEATLCPAVSPSLVPLCCPTHTGHPPHPIMLSACANGQTRRDGKDNKDLMHWFQAKDAQRPWVPP